MRIFDKSLMIGKTVNIATFNHDAPNTISDQIDFLTLALDDYAEVVVTKLPIKADTLIIVEYFDEKTILRVAEIKKKFPLLEIIIVLTEHLDLVCNELEFHGVSLQATDQYMSSQDKIARLLGLLKISSYADYFITLADLPELINFDEIICGKSIYRLYPDSNNLNNLPSYVDLISPQNDFLFYGNLTDYRKKVLENFSHAYKVETEGNFISNEFLSNKILNARFVLNIPQSLSWKWTSPMRIFKSLSIGRPVASISCGLKGAFDSIPISFELDETLTLRKEIRAELDNWQEIFLEQKKKLKMICREFNND